MYNNKWCNVLIYYDFSTFSDEELCSMSRSGNVSAEEALVERYMKLVRQLARRYYLAGGTSEDLIQEGMLGFLSAIREFDPDKNVFFGRFAEKCVKNRMFAGMRAANRDKHIPLNTYISIDPLSSDGQMNVNASLRDATDPEQSLLDRESYDELLARLTGLLSEFEARILGLYLDGLSIAEIAESVETKAKSVENAVSRVRRKSTRLLQKGDNR